MTGLQVHPGCGRLAGPDIFRGWRVQHLQVPDRLQGADLFAQLRSPCAAIELAADMVKLGWRCFTGIVGGDIVPAYTSYG